MSNATPCGLLRLLALVPPLFPLPEVKLLSVFWAGFGAGHRVPPQARIDTLPELERAARGERNIDYDAVRRGIGNLADLSPVAAGHSA